MGGWKDGRDLDVRKRNCSRDWCLWLLLLTALFWLSFFVSLRWLL